MRILRLLASFFILTSSVVLMGQANNCPDLGTLLTDLQTKVFQPPAGSKVYISNLSFLDARTKSIVAPGDADLINKAVEEGMTTVANQDKKYVVNDPQHTLKNNDANAQTLNTIFFDANLSRNEKTEKIVGDLMVPNKVDGLITGQFSENPDGSLSVRPIAISSKDKKFVTESLVLRKDEYKCPDPTVPTTPILCDTARTQIHDAVVRMIKQL